MQNYCLVSPRYFLYTGNESFEIGSLTLSNLQHVRDEFFYKNRNYQLGAGLASIMHFKHCSFFYNTNCELKFKDSIDPYEKFYDIAKLNHNFVEQLFYSLWYIKDNSLSVNYSDIFNIQEAKYFLRQVDYNPTTNCLGENEDSSWTFEEIFHGLEILQKILSIDGNYLMKRKRVPFTEVEGKMDEPVSKLFDYNDANRFERAAEFLVSARSSANLRVKISTYIMLLENIFGDSEHNGITEKVAQRTSTFLEDVISERQNMYAFLTVAYDIRSRQVHGNKLTAGTDNYEILKEVSLKLDGIVRKLMRKVVFGDHKKFLAHDVEDFVKSLSINNSIIKIPKDKFEIDIEGKIKRFVLKI